MRTLPLLIIALILAGCNDTAKADTSTPPADPPKTSDATPKPAEPTPTADDSGKQDGAKPAATDGKAVGMISDLGDAVPKPGEQIAVIETKFGKILLRFYKDVAPGHVKNFIDLASKGFYNGTKFHRIMPGFMIQGGDPLSKDDDPTNDGTGGPGYTIKAEFNSISHVRGILSMARSQDPDSAGSQFFIVQQASTFLDTQYTAFGKVCKDGTEKAGEEAAGLKVVDKIISQPAEHEIAKNPVAMTVKIVTWPAK